MATSRTLLRTFARTSTVIAATTVALAGQAPTLRSGIDTAGGNPKVRAGDDFFQHVNGTWVDTTAIPADRAKQGTFNMLADRAQEDLRVIAEEAAKTPDKAPGSDTQKIGDFYASFMDEARVDGLGLAPLQPELAAIDAIQTRSDVSRAFARLFKLNVIAPIVGFVEGDAKTPTENTLYAFQGGLGLPDRDYYFGTDPALETYRQKYVAFLTKILSLAGQPSPETTARDIFVLETELAKAHWTNVESRDAVKTYNRVELAALPREFPGLDWAAWTTELGIDHAPAIVVGQPSFVKTLAGMVEREPVDRWKPYLKALLLNGMAPYLSAPFADAEFDMYGRTLRGTEENEPRWKRAVTTLDANLGEMLGKLYVARHFSPDAKARMEQLVANIRAAFKDGIDRLEWMGPATKKAAQDKLAKFTPKIGYPNKWRDYSAVEVRPGDLVGNVQRAVRAENEYELSKVGKPRDPDEWLMTPQTVNAYYNPLRNEIVFPAAILQPPFFDVTVEDAANYGGIGAVIGHEMGHGFDDQGRRYDGSGALRDWWTEKDAQEYTKRAKALAAQYDAFEALPGLHVKGELTLGENIGDLTGVVIAHRAYLRSLGGRPAPTIDGLTADQRFFMSWAQVWRAKQRDDDLRQTVMTNPHSPAMFRVNGPLRNVPEFYRAFGVKETDRMFLAPAERVKIW